MPGATAVGTDGGAIGEVGRLDDERVALPVATRIAHQLLDAAADVRTAVERDDARVVHHLVGDDDRVGRLYDSRAVAVDHRQPRTCQAARDAAVVVVEVLDGVEGTHAVGTRDGAARACFRRERRDPAVRRIDDERGVAEVARALFIAEGACSRVVEITRLAALTRALREFLVGEVLARPELRRARHRHAAHVVARPDALEIGMAPRQLRRCPLRVDDGSGRRFGRSLGLRHGGYGRPQQSCDCHDACNQTMPHGWPLTAAPGMRRAPHSTCSRTRQCRARHRA